MTKTFLPELAEFVEHLAEIWETGHVTNHGPKVLELERLLTAYLGVKHVILVTNGTLALQVALRATNLSRDVVTTPFSYVATTSALVWEGLQPQFADIESDTLCLDPAAIEGALTSNTSGIVATHVYGNPCDVEAIADVARSHDLKVVYDAAHAFGVRYRGQSLLAFGDASILSFHATKLFHTIEGGAITTNDDEIATRARYMRNFGHDGPEAFVDVGINGKMSELQAAMGLTLLPRIDELINRRGEVCARYDELFLHSKLSRPVMRRGTRYNHAYYPILFETESILSRVVAALEVAGVFPRRYFYPALTRLPYVATSATACPIAEDVAKRILCLPLYPQLKSEDIDQIAGVVKGAL